MLHRDSTGPDVEAWQHTLARLGFFRADHCDGIFGRETEKATIAFQIAHGLLADGVAGPKTLAAAGQEPPPVIVHQDVFDTRWQFLQSKNYTKVAGPRTVTLVTMHTMQAPDKPDTAEGVAAWFAGARGPAPIASSHVCGDVDSIVQCVKPNDVAYGAPGGNSIGYHCEQGGYAEWTRDQWLQQGNMSMLRLMASHVALALAHFKLPQVILTDDEVASCVRDALIVRGGVHGTLSGVAGGLCEHRQLTRVWQAWSKYGLPNPRLPPKPWWPTHTDCGDGYPIDVLLDLVKQGQ